MMQSVQIQWLPSWGAWLSDRGTHFRVWAPLHSQIEVVLQRPHSKSVNHSLVKQPDGTFQGLLADAQAGDLYHYRVDQKNVYPDPASRFQPQGVHGPSQIVDFRTFGWTDRSWKGIQRRELTIYELHVGTFTAAGTFDAIIEHLPNLMELGITAIQLMPIGDFPGLRNWGYDGVALYAPARCYGSPDELRRLVNAAHETGLAVILDVVYNHFGPDGNYTGVFSPYYTTDKHHTAWGKSMNFDADHNAFVRQFFIENALHWIHEYHFDGLRLDATHAIQDTSAKHVLQELAESVNSSINDRIVHVIAEDNRNLARLVRPPGQGGFGLSAVWSDDFHHQVRRIAAGDHDGYFIDFKDSVQDLAATVQNGWLYSGQPSPFFKAPRGSDPSGLSLDQFVFFIQNHDQIGNRAMGDRLNHRINPPEYRALSTLLLLLPEIPLLFMGQEWAATSPFLYFTDHDEELGKAVAEGRKKEFEAFTAFEGSSIIPDPQSPRTFQQSKLAWSERLNEPHESTLQLYRALLQLRRTEFAPVDQPKDFRVSSMNPSTIIVKRKAIDGLKLLVVVQLRESAKVDLTTHPSLSAGQNSWMVLMTTEDKSYCSDGHPPVIHLAGEEPIIEFTRPGAVILKEHPHQPAHGK